MGRIRIKNEIEIERNPVERILISVKDFFRTNFRPALFALLGFLIAACLTVAFLAYRETAVEKNMIEFEKIMKEYESIEASKNREDIGKIIVRVKEFTSSTFFGFHHDLGYYLLGNLYFSERQFKEAGQCLLTFAGKVSDPMLKSVALFKAGAAAEESGDLDSALEIYMKLENIKKDNIVEDQVYYCMARVYEAKGDLINSKKYLNMLISGFPQSPLTESARKRLIMMPLGNKK